MSHSKRIAKNTMLLYFRMLITMGVTLYTSRIILDVLGVQDYGIYSVVGGITLIFSFVNNSMSTATLRFLTLEIGKDDKEKLAKTFSSALTVHILIAFIVLILGETIGLWWLENKLVIAPERMDVVRWIYQLSLGSIMVTITQVPYNSIIIAHERMNIYAYVEILNVTLKLVVVYLLTIANADKLLMYAIFLLCVSIVVSTVYKIYCVKNFAETKYKIGWNSEIIKPMLNFSGWNVLGTFSYAAKTQGVNVLLNLFVGVAANAAFGIATQVQTAVQSFASSIITASNPQIVKHYGANEFDQMNKLIIWTSKLSFLLVFVISFPLITETHFILQLWLKDVPDYAVAFSQLNLIAILLVAMFTILSNAIYATGKLRSFSIISSITYILVMPISYFLLKAGYSATVPFIVNILLLIVGYSNNLRIAKKNVPKFSIKFFIVHAVLTNLLTVLTASAIPLLLHFYMGESFLRVVLVGFTCVFGTIVSAYFIAFDKETRQKTVEMIINKIRK